MLLNSCKPDFVQFQLKLNKDILLNKGIGTVQFWAEREVISDSNFLLHSA